jgi:hypothetical protein
VVKLGLHQFLNDHAHAASVQANSAYADLVRLTGHDPATEIFSRFSKEAAYRSLAANRSAWFGLLAVISPL